MIEFDKPAPEDSLNAIEGLYPESYKAPTMKMALKHAGLNDSQISTVMTRCYENARNLGMEDKLPPNITVDDAAAIAMYTFDFGMKMYDSNPYRIINSALYDKTEESIERAKDLLYLVMAALRKLPVVYDIDLPQRNTRRRVRERRST